MNIWRRNPLTNLLATYLTLLSTSLKVGLSIARIKSLWTQPLPTITVTIWCIAIAGCHSINTSKTTERLFDDALFKQVTTPIHSGEVFSLSNDMRNYLRKEEIKSHILKSGLKKGLFDILLHNKTMRIEYDAEMTRNAAQTFADQSGNCLSLVIMTAAFAEELGLDVQFQSVIQENTWSRSKNLMFEVGHVNISLSRKDLSDIRNYSKSNALIIDFLPSEQLQNQKIIQLERKTILSMYMNNRAVELISQNRIDDAYWYAKQAIIEDRTFLTSYNTLGVIYTHHNNYPQAESAFREVLKFDNKNLNSINNLALTLKKDGRIEESQQLLATLQQLQPVAPFHYFEMGKTALESGRPSEAIDLIKKEMERDPDYHEFHLWLALSYIKQGNIVEAQKELLQARSNTITRSSFDFYNDKMNRLTASMGNSH